MTNYKVTSPDGDAIHGGAMRWSLPVERDGVWVPGDWHTVAPPIVACQRGLHLTSEWESWYRHPARVWEAEGAGESDENGNKTAFERARLLRPATMPDWWVAAMAFVDSIAETPWFQAVTPPDPEWRLYETLAAADAAWHAAWHAARDAAREAAREAAWHAAGEAASDAAWHAVRGAAWAAAGDAAWDAAREAAGEAAREAARDAVLRASCLVADLTGPHAEHSIARWDVWQRGYGLLYDVDGVLYVYRRP